MTDCLPVGGRVAIYFAPARRQPLARFGRAVFFPDRESSLTPPPHDHAAATRQARHYGFHATLKAPFELAAGRDLRSLDQALADFCTPRRALLLRGLRPEQTGRLLALTCDPCIELAALAFAVVQHFEPWRGALRPEDIARRAPDRLTARQRAQLWRFGYPFVGDDFQFHMTLADSDNPAFLPWLQGLYRQWVTAPVWLDRLCLFVQPHRAAPFRCWSQHAMHRP